MQKIFFWEGRRRNIKLNISKQGVQVRRRGRRTKYKECSILSNSYSSSARNRQLVLKAKQFQRLEVPNSSKASGKPMCVVAAQNPDSVELLRGVLGDQLVAQACVENVGCRSWRGGLWAGLTSDVYFDRFIVVTRWRKVKLKVVNGHGSLQGRQ